MKMSSNKEKSKLMRFKVIAYFNKILINPLASSSEGAPTLNYGDVNTVTPSPGEVKGLIFNFF